MLVVSLTQNYVVKHTAPKNLYWLLASSSSSSAGGEQDQRDFHDHYNFLREGFLGPGLHSALMLCLPWMITQLLLVDIAISLLHHQASRSTRPTCSLSSTICCSLTTKNSYNYTRTSTRDGYTALQRQVSITARRRLANFVLVLILIIKLEFSGQ